MKYFIPLFIILLGFVLHPITSSTIQNEVNPVIGDESYTFATGHKFDKKVSEQQRIRIHLAYVEQKLRNQPTDHLSADLKKKRTIALDWLNTYWRAGEFPSNYDYPGTRKPCFRDKEQQICAVGYLVQQSGREDLVREIEKTMNYATIYEMDNEALAKWVAQSGLTLEECAMIQPTYNFPQPEPEPSPILTDPDYVPAGYSITSASLSGLSAAMSATSIIQLRNGKSNWITPALGIGSGVSQIVMGSVYYNKDYSTTTNVYGTVYKRNQNLSMMNIGIGTFTAALNTYALIRTIQGKKKRTDLSWNVFGYQDRSSKYTVGFNLVKQF